MDHLAGWVVNIIVFLMLAMIVDMLLPDSSMKKYVKLVTGLLLVAIILNPLFTLLSADFEQVIAGLLENEEAKGAPGEMLVEEKKREIQASHHAYILEQMADEMKEGSEEELIEEFGLEIRAINLQAGIRFEGHPDTLEKVTVHVAEAKASKQGAVKPVIIDLSEKVRDEEFPDKERIKSLLSDRWEIQEAKIEVFAEGRNQQ
ncbi:MAG TPA: stage III sporulation protein AF [Bacillaceae bacterium]